MNAEHVRNMSLYVHNSTFSGKVTAIDVARQNFTMQSRSHGVQTILVNNLTVYQKNAAAATVQDLELGMTAKVKGTWERNYIVVTAVQVKLTARLVNIDITGKLVIKNDAALTVVARGVIYGVDLPTATLRSRNGKPVSAADLTVGGEFRVQGKHISEGTRITGAVVRDLSLV